MLENVVLGLSKIQQDLNDATELFEMAQAEGDDETLNSTATDIQDIEQRVAKLEFMRMFSHPMDPNNCFIDIQSGSGGTEAQDWASMLLRMYLRYCERKGFQVEILEQSDGEVAGIKGASLKVHRSKSAANMPMACCARKPAYTGWCANHRSILATAATPRFPACSSIPKWTIPSKWKSTQPTCA